MSDHPVRVLCVDDHPALAEGVRARLALEPDLEYVGGLTSADDLIGQAREQRPDVVLLDIAMPGTDPFAATADLQRHFPDVRVVFLTAKVRDHYMDAAFRAGAWGYLYKGDDLDEIVAAIKRVARGEYVLSPAVLKRIQITATSQRGGQQKRSAKLDRLTPAEVEVIRLIGRGLSRTDIAETLHRSVKTVDTHRAAIMEKLDIHDRTELALFAVREGLVDQD